MPLRYHGNAGQSDAYGNHHYGGVAFNDTMSLKSKTSSKYGRRNSCCIAGFLILAALILAVGIGLMVFFLLKDGM
mgnify:FL=1